MSHTISDNTLNPIQLHLLKMFAFNKQVENLAELKALLVEFYRQKVDEESDKIWNEKELTNNKMEELLRFQKRTSYE